MKATQTKCQRCEGRVTVCIPGRDDGDAATWHKVRCPNPATGHVNGDSLCDTHRTARRQAEEAELWER